MVPLALDIDGLTVALDPSDGSWRLSAGDMAFRLRPWSWGERQRLVSASTRGGRLDRAAFLHGLVTLLYDPAPPRALTPLFALAALTLMDVPHPEEALPLAEAEQRLAAQYGWAPGQLGDERAADLDRLVAGAAPAPQVAPPGAGWKSIRFSDPDAGGAA